MQDAGKQLSMIFIRIIQAGLCALIALWVALAVLSFNGQLNLSQWHLSMKVMGMRYSSATGNDWQNGFFFLGLTVYPIVGIAATWILTKMIRKNH